MKEKLAKQHVQVKVAEKEAQDSELVTSEKIAEYQLRMKQVLLIATWRCTYM